MSPPSLPLPPKQTSKSISLNRLVEAAEALLDLVVKVRSAPVQPDSVRVPNALSEGLETFAAEAHHDGYASGVVEAASKSLRLLIDESIRSTPWGRESVSKDDAWSQFQDLAYGPRQFLQALIDQLHLDNRDNDLLELFIVVLTLGMEGSLLAYGYDRKDIERLRTGLAQAVRLHTGGGMPLSPHWQAGTDERPSLASKVPLWVAATVAGLVLLGAYQGFRFAADQLTTSVVVETEFIARPTIE